MGAEMLHSTMHSDLKSGMAVIFLTAIGTFGAAIIGGALLESGALIARVRPLANMGNFTVNEAMATCNIWALIMIVLI